MRYYVLGDEETVTGFRLAGVHGEVAEAADAARLRETFQRLVGNPNIGILIITERLAEQLGETLDNHRVRLSTPLVVEVPDREGPLEGKRTLIEMITEAIGVRL